MQSACMDVPYWLKLVLIFGTMFAVVPLAGLFATGNWRQAWEYTRDWLRAIGFLVLAAAILGLLLLPFMPPPP